MQRPIARARLLSLGLSLLLVACGDGSSDADAGGGAADAAVAMDAGGGVDAGAAEDAGGGGIDAGLEDAGAIDAGAEDAGTPADAGDLSLTLADVAVYGNCMPIVAEDPILAFWTTNVADAGAATAATLTDAKLTITGSSTLVQSLVIDSPTVALSGGSGSQMQRKTGADVTPSDACGSYCGSAAVTWTLELTFDVGGATVPVTESGSFSCVY